MLCQDPVCLTDPENPELVTVGNEMDTSHIPPGYNHKILALDVDGKAQMIMIDDNECLANPKTWSL